MTSSIAESTNACLEAERPIPPMRLCNSLTFGEDSSSRLASPGTSKTPKAYPHSPLEAPLPGSTSYLTHFRSTRRFETPLCSPTRSRSPAANLSRPHPRHLVLVPGPPLGAHHRLRAFLRLRPSEKSHHRPLLTAPAPLPRRSSLNRSRVFAHFPRTLLTRTPRARRDSRP